MFGLRIFDFAYVPFNSTGPGIQLPSLRITVPDMTVTIKDDGDAGVIGFTEVHYEAAEGDLVSVTLSVTRAGLDTYATPATFTYETVGKGDVPVANSKDAADNTRLLGLLGPFQFQAMPNVDFVRSTGSLTFEGGGASLLALTVALKQDDLFEYPGEVAR